MRMTLRKFAIGCSVIGMTIGMAAILNADYRATVIGDGPIAYYTLDEVAGGDGTQADNLGTLGDDAHGEFFGEDMEADPGPGLPGFEPDNMAMRLTLFNETGEATLFEDASGMSVEEPILDEMMAFTLTGWINPSEIENSNRAGLFGQDNAIEFGFISGTDIQMWAELPDGGDVHINSLHEIEDDNWYHIALSADGIEGETFLYVNGEEQDLTEDTSMVLEDLGKDSFGVSGNPFNVGGGAIYGADRQFAGALDEIAVFDRALSETEIQAHYAAASQPVGGGNTGDYNGDGELGIEDINELTMMIAGGATDSKYDLNNDGSVTAADTRVWVKDLKNTFFGDSNMDGEFSSADFVTVFTAAKYENGSAAKWGEGDWNSDGVFTSSDFVVAFTDGGYEQGPAPAAVPEPNTLVLLATAGLCLVRRRR